MSAALDTASEPLPRTAARPILEARGVVKHFGRVVALDHADFELMPKEILGVIGDNGAGKSTLIKVLAGAILPDQGEVLMDGKPVHFRSPIEAREAGIETVFQNLALSPALSIADNLFLGRERRKRGPLGTVFRLLDNAEMRREARRQLSSLGLLTIQNINQTVETLSGGQRQGVAVVRATSFGSRVIIMDEPTAALGVKESRRVLELMLDVRKRGLPIILISHNMPHVFEVADRIHIHRLGKRIAVINPKQYSMSDAVAIMTGAMKPPPPRSGPSAPSPRPRRASSPARALPRRHRLQHRRSLLDLHGLPERVHSPDRRVTAPSSQSSPESVPHGLRQSRRDRH